MAGSTKTKRSYKTTPDDSRKKKLYRTRAMLGNEFDEEKYYQELKPHAIGEGKFWNGTSKEIAVLFERHHPELTNSEKALLLGLCRDNGSWRNVKNGIKFHKKSLIAIDEYYDITWAGKMNNGQEKIIYSIRDKR